MRLKRTLTAFSLGIFLFVMVFCNFLPSFPRMMLSPEPELIKEGPTLNPPASKIYWLEDLSWKEPPMCDSHGPFVLAVVISAATNFERRARVRKTWASRKYFNSTGVKVVFAVGLPGNNETLQEKLDFEIDKHEDIIQGDFMDTYKNLPYKTMAWLSWAKIYCPATPFIARIEDDVLVNPFTLRLYLQEHLAHNPSLRHIHGREKFRPKAKSIEGAMTQENNSWNKQSSVVLGSAYIVDRNAVNVLLSSIPHMPFLWLEDVFLSAVVADSVGVKLKQIERRLFTKRLRKLYTGPNAFMTEPKPIEWEKGWLRVIKYSHKIIDKLKKIK